MYNLYRFFSFFSVPFVYLNIYWRILKNKEDKNRYKERFGIPSISRPKNKIIWIHAASVGEFKSCHIIIETYHNKYSILVTTTTKTAAEYALTHYSNKIFHQYAPFDVEMWVNKFLKYWKPQLVLWIESDLWPNTLLTIKKNKIKCLFLNARISPKSFKRWSKVSKNYNTLLNTFSNIFAQSKDDLKRLNQLSSKKIEYIGNLKLSDNTKSYTFNTEVKKDDFSIMITSSHKEEEKFLLDLIKRIFIKYPKIQFYLAPRHPERSNSIKRIFDKENLVSSLESQQKLSKIIIIDSFGNLPKYFKVSDIVLLGGSFSNHGGHNPIEPAKYNCSIISGEHIFNWKNIYEEMISLKACYITNDINKLEEHIYFLLNNEDMLKKRKQNSLNYANKSFFDNKKLMDIINSNLIDNA